MKNTKEISVGLLIPVLNEIDGLDNPSSEFLSIWIWNKLITSIPILSEITVSEELGTGIKYSGK